MTRAKNIGRFLLLLFFEKNSQQNYELRLDESEKVELQKRL